MDRGRARAEADADRRMIHGRDELSRQSGRDAEADNLSLLVEQIDGAVAAFDDALDDSGDRLENRQKRRVGGDFFEHPPLAGRDGVAALAFGDVANTNDVAIAPVEAGLADRDLDLDPNPVLGGAPGLMG